MYFGSYFTNMKVDYFFILLSLFFSAFFSGMEIAFISANKLKIALDAKKGSRSARVLSRFLQKPSRFIGTMLVGNNIALVIFGIIMANVLTPFLSRISSNEMAVLILQTIFSTFLILIAGEFIPKVLFQIDPNRVLSVLFGPLIVIYYILWLPTIIITGFSEMVLKIFFKVNFSEDKPVFGRIDLDHYVKEMTLGNAREGAMDYEIQIFQNALDFSTVRVKECMVPRTEITAIDMESPIEKLRKKFIETNLTKILIYKGSVDNIIGYAHAHEMFKKPESIKNILLPISVMPQSMPASEALRTFIREKKSISVVVDEFGGTSGLVTIEDVVEEIFGEIEDEHDTEQHSEKKINEKEFEFSARFEIDYLNNKYSFGFPESDEYETLAGLILFISEDIPQENEKIEFQKWIFRIKKVTARRIELVNVIIKESGE